LFGDAISLQEYELSAGKEIVNENHALADLHQNRLEAVIPLPVCENRQLRAIDLAVGWAYEGKVDTCEELERGRLLRILLPAGDLETVDSILVHGLCHATPDVMRADRGEGICDVRAPDR
jgi:hypothetical protein